MFPPETSELHELDAQALEALLDAGLDPTQIDGELRERAARVAAILCLLDPPPESIPAQDDTLVHVTLARVHRHRELAQREAFALGELPGGQLCEDDEDAMEMLIAAGLDPARVPGRVRRRAAHIRRLLDVLDVASTEPQREALISATLHRAQEQVDAEADRMNISQRRSVQRMRGGWPRIRINDLVAVAAMILIAVGVLIPMGNAVREFGRRGACQANLMTAGLGLGQYSTDNKSVLPLATASPAGNSWWFVGDPQKSNSANLFTLTRTGYSKVRDLACPGNADACRDRAAAGAQDWRSLSQVSYSYQNMFAHERPTWDGRRGPGGGGVIIVILADRSPIVPLAIQHKLIHPLSNSLNHAGTGQNVLLNDGSVRWMRSPVMGPRGDNIYLPRPIEDLIARYQNLKSADPLHGTESPAGADDVFLTP